MIARGTFCLLCFFASACATIIVLRWEAPVKNVQPAELYAVVIKQVNAFRADDFPRAYQHASLRFQRRVQPGQFPDLIHDDYETIRGSDRVEFGAVQIEENRATMHVFFVGKNGQVVPCIYRLIREDESWKIDAADLREHWPSGHRLGGIRS